MKKIVPKFIQESDVPHGPSSPMPVVFRYIFEKKDQIVGIEHRPATGEIFCLSKLSDKPVKKLNVSDEAVATEGIAIAEMQMPKRVQDVLELHFFSVEDMQGKNLSMYKGIGKVTEKAILKRMEELLG